jgi:MFS family permease
MLCSFLQIFSPGLLTSVILMAFGALGNSVAFPNVSALISRATDADNQGQIFGLNNAAGAVSRVTGPLIANTAFAHAFVDAPFVLAAFVVAPAIVLALGAGSAAQRLERAHYLR